MAIIVQKYGGTSVGTLARIEAVAANIIATRREGHQVVVVLSAMAGETNRLLAMAKAIDAEPATRELDMLLATGEQVSIALLAMALIKQGFSAISLLAHQIGLRTNNHFGRARIHSVDNHRLLQALELEQVVIVAGFQGQDNEQNVTTLGRGGSDTSAVAIAAALQAAECQIFTDVDGIYSADPRLVPDARKLEQLSFEEMLVMASLGSKVLQNRAVEYAMRHCLPIRVLNSFSQNTGTLVTTVDNMSEEQGFPKPVSGISHHTDEALIELAHLSCAEQMGQLFTDLGALGIEIDLINQSFTQNNELNVSFSIHRNDYRQVLKYCQQLQVSQTTLTIESNAQVVKISAIGVGMKSHAGVAGCFFSALAKENIHIYLISTSEINISVIINEADLTNAVCALHKVFQLSSPT